MMSEEPGVSNSEICSTASGGTARRSSAALASCDDGTDGTLSTICCFGALRCLAEFAEVLCSGIETTLQRTAEPSFSDSMTVNTCVPSGSSRFWISTGTSNRGVKPRRTKSLLNFRLTKTDIGTTFCGAPAEGAEPAGWESAVSCTPILDIKGACVVAPVLLLLLATARGRFSDESNAVFGFETKRCGLVISTGTTSWRAMMTRAPRFVRCQSRMAKSFVKRMQPCEAG